MQLVSTIKPKLSLSLFFLSVSLYTAAQENSPFSRYGLGDPLPLQNVIGRALGGAASTYATSQSINLSNPASYSELKIVTYDIGVTLDNRTLKSTNPLQKYNSVNLTPAYVALGMPLNKKRNIGLAFGLRPLTRVSYSIEERKRLRSDSMAYVYEGDGGLYQFFLGLGKRWGNLERGKSTFRIGFNTGYNFGRKENITRAIPLDSVLTYKSNSTTLTTFGSGFINGGLQYEAKLNTKGTSSIRFGVAGNLKQTLKAEQQINRETFTYDANGLVVRIDSVFKTAEQKGNIQLPLSYSAGISLHSYSVDQLGGRYEKSMIIAEYESTQWADYRFYNQPDKLANSYLYKLGAQLTPNFLTGRSYWSKVTYRAGMYYGKEGVNADGKQLPVYGVTLGAGFPIRRWRAYDDQYTNINTTFEIGKRGGKENNITESFFRLSFGFNLSDVWFKKRRYD
ncbi:MAG TPA: hypothetical protein VF610_12640 [Segetibacter sp.]|jgi:hypothetical protein